MAQIDESLAAMVAEVEHIAKERKNQQQGYNFRGIDDVYNAVHPLLAKYGVYPTCKVLSIEYSERKTDKGSTLLYARGRFEYTFHAKDGSTVASEALGEAMDSGDKAANKAMSNAYKYAIFQMLCIPTMAVDGDSETPPPSTPAAAPQAGRDAFGSQQPAAKPKPFSWPKAPSAEKLAYTLAAIDTARKHPDPVQAGMKIKAIYSNPKLSEMAPSDMAKVAEAIVKAEQDLAAECAGSGA